uniref:Ig-like domain-containing protein n=1 Tax=Calidris pygmaea TaxID=425635 RepID=A0A8C3JGH0_9CHAR
MRMWTAWCVAMYFLGARAEITQTSSLVLKEDEKATLTCSQNDNHNTMYWYLQQPGKGLQLIYYSIGANMQQEGDIPTGYKANRLNRENFNLDILSVKVNHSGVYFCASSLDTTLQSHLLSLQKLLSSTLLQKGASLNTAKVY